MMKFLGAGWVLEDHQEGEWRISRYMYIGYHILKRDKQASDLEVDTSYELSFEYIGDGTYQPNHFSGLG